MPSPSVEVHLNRHAGVLQSQIVDSRILHVHWIILRLHNERWWRLLRYMDLRIRREVLFRKRQISRINDNGEVRPATQLISRINRVIKPLIKVCAQSRCQMRASRKPKNSDSLRINVPLRRMRPHHSQRPLCIIQRRRRLGIRP